MNFTPHNPAPTVCTTRTAVSCTGCTTPSPVSRTGVHVLTGATAGLWAVTFCGLWGGVVAAQTAHTPSSAAPATSTSPATAATFKETFATPALLQSLRKGGYVLYMRHGNTNNDLPDQPNLKLDDCSTQRPLNDEGRAVVTQVGQAIAKARLPVGDVWVSPMCRAKESAQLAFGDKAQVDNLLMYTSLMTTVQKQPILANTRRLLSEPVAPGTNRVVVAHAPNLADLMGFFVKPEGTVVVISPLGDRQFRYVASIHPQHWGNLLK